MDPSASPNAPEPFPEACVAVCVCTCQRPRALEQLLTRLAHAELDAAVIGRPVRIVIVDNAPDGTAQAICESHRRQLPVPLHFVTEPQRGISMARNRAVATAQALGARLIAFVDDDDLPAPDWLRQLALRQAQTDADMVFGLAMAPAGLAVPRLLHGLNDFRPRSLDRLNRYGLPAAAGTCNVLLHRRLVDALTAEGPLFLPELAFTGGGDSELFARAHRQGFTNATAPDSLVTTGFALDRLTVAGVLRRQYRYGTSQVAVASRHLDADELLQMRHAAWRKLVKATWRLPLAVTRPRRLVERLAEVARGLGKLAAFRGRRYRYYDRAQP